MAVRVVLASASPARLRTLQAAGLQPEVVVSGVDESTVTAARVPDLAGRLARLKSEAVASGLAPDARPTVVVGCDSLLELDGTAYGKPGSPAEAEDRWRRMRGRSGVLHTGHFVLLRRDGVEQDRSAVAFTVDGLGGPFVTGIEGDYHNVVGLSLPLLRGLLRDLGLAWPDLWAQR